MQGHGLILLVQLLAVAWPHIILIVKPSFTEVWAKDLNAMPDW